MVIGRSAPPTPGRQGLLPEAGQWFDAETKSGLFFAILSSTVPGFRGGATALTATLTATLSDSGRSTDVCRDTFCSSEYFYVPS